MKRFHYIDEDAKEQLDLVWLFEYAADHKLNHEDIIAMLSKLNKHVTILYKNG